MYFQMGSRRTGRRSDLAGWLGGWCRSGLGLLSHRHWGGAVLFGVKVWNFLLWPFGESRSPLGLLLPHLGGIFLYSPISIAPSSSSASKVVGGG